MTNQPKTQAGRDFLVALRKLMQEHKVEAIVGWDTGDCWIRFTEDMKCNEPIEFTLEVSSMLESEQ